MKLVVRVGKVIFFIILVILVKVKVMKVDGIDVCSFSVGEFDFDILEYIKAVV